MAITIRTAVPADVPQILVFIRALAAYERAPDAVTATEANLLNDGFGPNPFYFCLIAEQDGHPAGFALYFFNYSTWWGRPGIYLEDLFVHPEFRGLGIGKALLQKVAAIAIEKGCTRLNWEVLDWNTPAIDFYRAMGAEFLDEWRNVRVSGEALNRLAGAAEPVKNAPRVLSSCHSEQPDSRHRVTPGNEPVGVPKKSRAPSFPLLSAERVGDHKSQPLSADEEAAH
jgi:GNAT superfamily N-acetyltransferase